MASSRSSVSTTLFLCGDLMTGRGIDQILPHPSQPQLFEPHVHSALDYVALAERMHGAIARPVAFEYVWGVACGELALRRPAARIANLETAVTAQGRPWPGKGIHYRMHPANVPCLTALGLDCCVLANNHVMDWGRDGLIETLAMLESTGLRTAGAGSDAARAAAPAAIDPGTGGGRVLVFAFATEDSGVPRAWRAGRGLAGVNLLPEPPIQAIDDISRVFAKYRRRGDLVVASIHWGPNWQFGIRADESEFAHRLIDAAGAQLVHGHSSHHVRGIEVYAQHLILYGCGDFLNDYEGIGGQDAYRGELGLMYFPVLSADDGRLVSLTMKPICIRRLRVDDARPSEVDWLQATLDREGQPLGSRVERSRDGVLQLRWRQ